MKRVCDGEIVERRQLPASWNEESRASDVLLAARKRRLGRRPVGGAALAGTSDVRVWSPRRVWSVGLRAASSRAPGLSRILDGPAWPSGRRRRIPTPGPLGSPAGNAADPARGGWIAGGGRVGSGNLVSRSKWLAAAIRRTALLLRGSHVGRLPHPGSFDRGKRAHVGRSGEVAKIGETIRHSNRRESHRTPELPGNVRSRLTHDVDVSLGQLRRPRHLNKSLVRTMARRPLRSKQPQTAADEECPMALRAV